MTHSEASASAEAFARERRRPPLRPRRRGREDSASPSSPPSSSAAAGAVPASAGRPRSAPSRRRPRRRAVLLGFGRRDGARAAASAVLVGRGVLRARLGRPSSCGCGFARRLAASPASSRALRDAAPRLAAAERRARSSAFRAPWRAPRRPRRPPRRRSRSSAATAAVRPASSIRTSFFSPTNAIAVGDGDQVAVDLRDAVVRVVHVRLDDVDVDLLARAERHRVLLDLLARALHRHREVVERQALGALEVEVAGRSAPRARAARARRRR